MRIAVIGASGHIGSYLVPELVCEGHDVIAISRGRHRPYTQHPCWDEVRSVELDRSALEARGEFAAQICALQAEVVIDLICFTPASARQLADALKGKVGHFLHCGTIWVYGPAASTPTTETEPRRPLGEYGQDKAAIESLLLQRAAREDLPATVIHPGHIVGPGWVPLNPAGNFNPDLFENIAAGHSIHLPDQPDKTLHHIHAADVAQVFLQAIRHPDAAIGQSFNAVSDCALALRDYAEGLFRHFGHTPRAHYLPLMRWKLQVSDADYQASLEHLEQSSNCSNARARELLGYRPRYSSLEAVLDALPLQDAP